jgi:hypothetical protein
MAPQRQGDPPSGLHWLLTENEGARLRYIRHVHGVGRPPHINLRRMGLPDPRDHVIVERVLLDDLYRDGGGEPSNPEFTKFWST